MKFGDTIALRNVFRLGDPKIRRDGGRNEDNKTSSNVDTYKNKDCRDWETFIFSVNKNLTLLEACHTRTMWFGVTLVGAV